MNAPASDRPRWFDPESNVYRWSVMVAAGLMLVGGTFAFESLGSVSQLLVDQEGFTTTRFGLSEGMYHWPNALGTVLLAGILVDKLGTRMMSFVFSGVVVLGAVIIAMAPNYLTLLIGRAVLGIGVETLGICQSAILCKWFRDRDLALAFGLTLAFIRLGSVAAYAVETPIANRYGGSGAAFWLAAITCVFSLAAAVSYVVLDRAADADPEDDADADADADAEDDAEPSKLDARFWYLVIITTACYCAIRPFGALAQDFIHDKWGIAATTGARIVGILPLVSLISVPAIGWAIDKIGRRTTLITVSTILLVAAHLVMGLTSLHPLSPMLSLALAYAIIAAVVWPAVKLVGNEKIIGTAFGLLFTIQNLGLATFPWLSGALRQAAESYVPSQLMFASLGLVALVFALLLRRADRRQGDVLENTVDAAPDEQQPASAVG